jgi:hypothetical protein
MAGPDEGAKQDLSREVASLESHRTHGSARKLIAWVVALVLIAAAAGAAAPRPEGSQPAAGPARENFDAKKHFTITKIQPDAGREEVKIFFSQPVYLAALRANLRLLPHVRIDWKRSTLSPGGILTLRGAFRYGTGYLVLLPDNLMVGTKSYLKTVSSFFMPDRPPKVEFVERKTAIERDSRQLLHVRAQNVNNLMFEGIKVPPLLLPWALAVEKAPQDWEGLLDRLKSGQDLSKSLVEKKKELARFVSPPLLERQLFPAAGEKNKLWAVSLPLSFRQGKEAGALELIRVKDNQSGSAASTGPRVFQITDLGLTYKRGAQDLLVWVTSLKKGTPVAGAQVVGFTTDMEVFPLGQTDAEGILIFRPKELEGLSIKSSTRLEPVTRLVEKDRLALVLVGTGDDVSFIELQPGGNLKPQGIWQVQAGEQVRYL